jgi:hypothetical protein
MLAQGLVDTCDRGPSDCVAVHKAGDESYLVPLMDIDPISRKYETKTFGLLPSLLGEPSALFPGHLLTSHGCIYEIDSKINQSNKQLS